MTESENDEIVFSEDSAPVEPLKERHGCVTAWLYLLIVANSVTSLTYLFMGDFIIQNLESDMGKSTILLLAVLGIFNVSFAVMLLRWRKVGFWGFTLTSFVAFGINVSMGIGIGQSILGLLSIGILYGILQFKKYDTPAWTYLD